MSKKYGISLVTFGFMATVALLVGCSAKVEGPAGGDIPGSINLPSSPPRDDGGFMDTRPTISGPALTGQWTSACIEGRFSEGQRKLVVTVDGSNITRTEQLFSDDNCQTKTSEKTDAGIFRYIENSNDGGFTVEYKFDLGNGVHSFPQEKVWSDADHIYVSDFAVGDAVTKDMAIALSKQGTVAPPRSCTDYSGNWNMNGAFFQITQKGCEEVHWIEDGEEDVYVTDGVERSVGGSNIKSYFKNANWMLEYDSGSGGHMVSEYSLQKAPCDLANPDGSDYLTRTTYLDGQFYRCTFFARSN